MLLNAWRHAWNNTHLMKKIMFSFILFAVVILLVFLYIVYMNINVYSRKNADKDLEKALLSSASELENRMIGFESATSIMMESNYFANMLFDDYTSNYALYYDVVRQFDPAVSTLRLFHPEFIGLTIFMDHSEKIERTNFVPLTAMDPEILTYMNTAHLSTYWTSSYGVIYLYKRIYDTTRIPSYAIVSFRIDYDEFFAGIEPSALENYHLDVFDRHNLIYHSNHARTTEDLDTLAAEPLPASVLSVSRSISNQWNLRLRTVYQSVPLSAFISEQTIIIVTFAAIAVAFLASFVIAKSIGNRILRLNDYVSSMVENEFTQEFVCNDQDEVGSIIRNVNNMAQQTRRLINENYTRQLLQNEAEIKMLQAQINPHFLYNTLSVLNWNAINHGDMETSEIITSLSAFYRSMIGNTNMVATLEQELTLIQSYLRIRRVTCNHSIELTVRIPDSLLDYELPHITLQPIVENAIDHGIEASPPDMIGRLIIEARESADQIIITIADNGPGIEEERLPHVLDSVAVGYGLSNVNTRLKLFFAPEYGIELVNLQPRGLKVTILIPKYVSL